MQTRILYRYRERDVAFTWRDHGCSWYRTCPTARAPRWCAAFRLS
jgi:hypothetical protein